MKNLGILLLLAAVLGMAGCNTEEEDDDGFILSAPAPRNPFDAIAKDFNESLERWTEQGISDYSFVVSGYEFEPNIPFGPDRPGDIPSDAKFCARVTVADGGIVSVENIGPGGERPSTRIPIRPDEELGAYTWGADSGIIDKILSIAEEEASSPYAYHWYIGSNISDYWFPCDIKIEIYNHDPFRPYAWIGAVLLYNVSLFICNFQVTENVPQ